MHPHIHLLGFTFPTYGLLLFISILAVLLFLKIQSAKHNIKYFHLYSVTIVFIIFLYIGANLLDSVILGTGWLNFKSGLFFYGGLITGLFAVYIYSRYNGHNWLNTLNICAPAWIIAHIIGRIACFMAGCCYGSVTTAEIGIRYPISHVMHNHYVHAVQIYESLWLFCVFLLLLWLEKKNKKFVFLSYIALYSFGRFFLEYFRADPRGTIFIFSTSQFISLILFLISIISIYAIRNRLKSPFSEGGFRGL